MKFCLLLTVVVILLPAVTSQCPPLANTSGVVKWHVTWTYNLLFQTCTGQLNGSPGVGFGWLETKALSGAPCLKFKCDYKAKGLVFQPQSSACEYGSDCSTEKKTDATCGQQYSCFNAVYKITQLPQFDYWTSRGRTDLFTGYTCGNSGSGHCDSNQCFNPFGDLKQGPSLCIDVGQQVAGLGQIYECQENSTCATYSDLVLVGGGCDVNGTVVPLGSVTWSDACSHTVCQLKDGRGQLVTSFKNDEGCVYEDRCVAVGDTIDGVVQYRCAELTCRKDTSGQMPKYTLEQDRDTGCHYNGRCYKENRKVSLDDQCKYVLCSYNPTTQGYYWGQRFKGCYDPETGSCDNIGNGKTIQLNDCVKIRCVASQYGLWRTHYKTSAGCVPSKRKCEDDNGIPGCRHNGRCYPVKSVIRVDNCTQFVCYSNNSNLNEGIYTTNLPRPAWLPRATGCYGPKGCMALGEEYVDVNTLNTYRCDYDFNHRGKTVKFVKFHIACVAPNGAAMAVGQSLLIDPVWYSCYRKGKLGSFNLSDVKPVAEGQRQCGINPATGRPLYKAEEFFTAQGICTKRGPTCEWKCQYFDQPCPYFDVPLTWYSIGQEFNLNNSECVCTQDYDVNNQPVNQNVSLHFAYKTPSLCGEPGVFGSACKDPDDGSLHQWGELWERFSSGQQEVCTCHPLERRAFCDDYLPNVINVTNHLHIDGFPSESE